MKTKIIEEPVYETKQVVTASREVTLYIAEDGKEFRTKIQCENYESQSKAIAEGQNQFSPVTFATAEREVSVVSLFFGGYGSISDVQMVMWKKRSQDFLYKKALDYLWAKGFHKVYDHIFQDIPEGEPVIIASWIEDYNTDYPSYKTSAISRDDFVKKLDDFVNSVKTAIINAK
jgi:hypothetical protein